MEPWHETDIRVRYSETDAMGIVHNANYFIWFEVGRSEMCRDRGFSYKDMEEQENAYMVVAESYCRYKSPAFYEDVLTIRTQIGEMRSRSLRFIYEIYRAADDTLIAEGETLHVITDSKRNVRSFPESYRIRLGELSEEPFPADQAPS